MKLICLLVAGHLHAQKKFSLEINVGALHSVGKDISKTYHSTQPLSIQYLSRAKFEHTYFNLLPNLTYAVKPGILLGFQSGIYAHFNERYGGARKPVSVAVPLLATGRFDITDIKSSKLGISLAGGKNYFSTDTYPYDLKNGWLFNASVFYLLNQKSIFKLGVEQQIDNGYVYSAADAFLKEETFKYHLNRVSIALSYGWIIKKF
jgi:hypothetical protein